MQEIPYEVGKEIQALIEQVKLNPMPKAPKLPQSMPIERAAVELAKAFQKALERSRTGGKVGVLPQVEKNENGSPWAANAKLAYIAKLPGTKKAAAWAIEQSISPFGWSSWCITVWPKFTGKDEDPPVVWALNQATMAKHQTNYTSYAAGRSWGNTDQIQAPFTSEYKLFRQQIHEQADKYRGAQISLDDLRRWVKGPEAARLASQAQVADDERWREWRREALEWNCIWF